MADESSYTPAFLKAIAFILPHEEEFARGHWGDENYVIPENVDGDSGGWTKYGIDQSSHRGVDVRNLDRAGAIAIYWREWLFREMDKLPEKLAIAMFDVWVNGGYAVRWLQAAINAVGFRAPQKDFKLPLQVDGDPGPSTLAAAWACDQAAVLNRFINERDARFESIADRFHQDRQFLAGWEQRDRDLRKFLTS